VIIKKKEPTPRRRAEKSKNEGRCRIEKQSHGKEGFTKRKTRRGERESEKKKSGHEKTDANHPQQPGLLAQKSKTLKLGGSVGREEAFFAKREHSVRITAHPNMMRGQESAKESPRGFRDIER